MALGQEGQLSLPPHRFPQVLQPRDLPVQVALLLFQQGEETAPARKLLLAEQRQRLAERIEEMQAVLARLDCKIEGYDRLAAAESKLRRSRD